MRTKLLLITLVFNCLLSAQGLDVSNQLRQIENGDVAAAESFLREMKSKNPNDPSVIFLDAVLTINGEDAAKKYSLIVEKFPKSKYADASLYRLFSYYYSLGYYKKAETYLTKLKTEFPSSPYIKAADRNIPDVEEVVQITPEIKTESAKYNFTIQAGAFLNFENAKKLSEQFKSDGYHSEITSKEVGGTVLNVVNIGKFQNESDTKSVLDYLSKKYNLNGRIVKLTN